MNCESDYVKTSKDILKPIQICAVNACVKT